MLESRLCFSVYSSYVWVSGKSFGTSLLKADHTFCKCSNCLQLLSERAKYEKQRTEWGAWVAQSVEGLTLGFGSGLDLGVVGSSPCRALHSVGSRLKILSPSPSVPPPLQIK